MEFGKVNEFDDKLFFKRSTVNISSSNRFSTPLKASNPSEPISEVNEIYKRFNTDSLDKIISDEKTERNKNSEVRRLKTENNDFFFVDYNGNILPRKDHLEFLVDLQYSHSDVIITPIFSTLMKNLEADKQINTLIELTDKSLEIVKTLNNKQVLGLIPGQLPRQSLKKLLKYYYNHGITCFAIDYDGRSVDSNSSWETGLTRIMAEYDIIENSFIYGLNVYQVHFRKNTMRELAKDFISIGYGIDILGCYHIQPRMGPKGWNEYKNKEKMHRFFDSSDYSYVRYLESELAKEGPIIDEEIKNYNIETQYTESQILQEKLNENDPLEPYIQNKDKVTDKLIKDMLGLREEALKNSNTAKLDKFFF